MRRLLLVCILIAGCGKAKLRVDLIVCRNKVTAEEIRALDNSDDKNWANGPLQIMPYNCDIALRGYLAVHPDVDIVAIVPLTEVEPKVKNDDTDRGTIYLQVVYRDHGGK